MHIVIKQFKIVDNVESKDKLVENVDRQKKVNKTFHISKCDRFCVNKIMKLFKYFIHKYII